MRRLILAALITCFAVGTPRGSVVRHQGSGRERQTASRRCQDELRAKVQARHLQQQSGKH